jgi:hypothetical protein
VWTPELLPKADEHTPETEETLFQTIHEIALISFIAPLHTYPTRFKHGHDTLN